MLKRKHIIATLIAIVAMTISSCELETSGNGDLDGYWHLVKVDTLSTDGSTDLSDSLLFWAVEVNILNAVDRNGTSNFLLRFSHKDDTLRLYEPRYNDRMNGDPEVEDATELQILGIEDLDVSYLIEKLTHSRMILSTNAIRLNFKKM